MSCDCSITFNFSMKKQGDPHVRCVMWTLGLIVAGSIILFGALGSVSGVGRGLLGCVPISAPQGTGREGLSALIVAVPAQPEGGTVDRQRGLTSRGENTAQPIFMLSHSTCRFRMSAVTKTRRSLPASMVSPRFFLARRCADMICVI